MYVCVCELCVCSPCWYSPCCRQCPEGVVSSTPARFPGNSGFHKSADSLVFVCPSLTQHLSLVQTCLASKTTPPLMRAAYLLCVLAMCKEEADSGLLPLPLQSLERAASATSLQPPVLVEAVVAIHVAIKLSFPDPIPPPVWSLAESHSKQLVSNKLLTAASQDSKDVGVACGHGL